MTNPARAGDKPIAVDVEAGGLNANISLLIGTTIVILKATDNDGNGLAASGLKA